jgi:hypothetical protein
VQPRTISTIGTDALTAQVALDTAGNAIVVWARAKGRTWVIQSAYRPFGGAWEAPRDLSLSSSLAGAPQVAFGPAGDAVAVWQRFDGIRLGVQTASRSASTGSWSRPQNLSRSEGDALSPQISVDADGNALAVWVASGGGQGPWEVQSAYRPNAGAWQQPELVTRNPDEVVSPQLVFDARGGAVAAWAALLGTNWAIETSERARGGGWHASLALAAAGEYPRVRVLLRGDGKGQLFALWEGLSGVHAVVQAAIRSAAQKRWSDVRDLSDDRTDAVSPQLAVDARGDAVAVWAQKSGRNWVVHAAKRRSGKAWEVPVMLSSPGRDAVAPDVALDPRGNAVAVWVRSNGTNTIVQSSYRPLGDSSWSRARTISEPEGDAVSPAVAVDASGNGTLVWSRFDGTGFAAQVSGYDAVGPELRRLAFPDVGVVGEPVSFSVAPLDAWSRVTATRWTFGDGGTASGERAEHAYARPGRYRVRVTSTDAVGLRTTASHGVVIQG